MKNEIKTSQMPKVELKKENHSETSIDQKKLNTAKRQADCIYGHHGAVDSDSSLPFFKRKPEKDKDEYYCGCHGWD